MRLDLSAPIFLPEDEVLVFVACTTRDPKNLRSSTSALRCCSETPRRYVNDCSVSLVLVDSSCGGSLK